MKRLMTVLCTLLFFAFLTPIASADPVLFEGYVVSNGGGPLDLVSAGFVGMGTITVPFLAGNAGSHFVGLYVDYEIDEEVNTFFNEYGAASGVLPAGMSWEIDQPFTGDIYSNFFASNAALSALDGTNSVLSSAPDDVAMALGWNFSLTDTDTASIQFLISDIEPTSGFYLTQTDPDSLSSIYLSSSLVFNEGSAPIPEPGTWALLLTGLTMIGATAKRFGKRS